MSVGQDRYLGFVALGQPLSAALAVRAADNTLTDADAPPPYKVYGPDGLMQNGTGNLVYQETGAVADATNATPVVITSLGHGLVTGQRVTLAGVTGNAGANGTFPVTAIDPNTFSLDGSAGTGAYVSGGAWHTSGLYNLSLIPSGANGYQQGVTYTVLVNPTVAGAIVGDCYSFTVV